jgi:hypothetical protein
MTLAEWDKEVGPHLRLIEAGAEMTARHARLMLAKPGFPTIAEDRLSEARAALQKALAKIDAAQAVYSNKQLEQA